MHTNRANHLPIKPTSKTIKILLVDDQKFVQQKLQQILSPEADLQIVGTASDGETAIAQVESLNPDMVLIDIEMPKMNGIEATKIISQRFPDCKILILSSYEHQEYVQKIISVGADGYILKTTPPDDLVTAIHSVCKGYSHFGSQLLKKVQLAEIEAAKLTAADEAYSPIVQPDFRLASGEANDMLPPVSKWLTWGGISVVMMVILAVPASAVFKYKTVVKAQAVVRPVGELDLVQAAVEGQIDEILVKEGQTVDQGQAIATVDRSRFEMKKNQLNTGIEQQRLQLSQLNAQTASLSSQIVAETERNQSEIAAAGSELVGSQRNYRDKNAEATTLVEEYQAQVRAVEATLNAARVKYKRYQSVAQAGAISQEQLSEAKLEVQRQEQELQATRAKLKRVSATLNPTTSEIEISQQRIEQAKKSGRATIASLNREQEALVQQSLEIEKQLDQDLEELNQIDKELTLTKITATDSGRIFQLSLRNPGQTIQSGQEIAQIIPQNSQLEMKAIVSPEDISKLEVGQKVQMRVSACPYPDYGTLQGTVSQIAGDTSKKRQQADSSSQVETSTAFYEVLITPNSNVFGTTEKQCSLQVGMESRADIISREETLLQFIVRKTRLTINL
jgi:HlyD family type I secretion membrane fusion protein